MVSRFLSNMSVCVCVSLFLVLFCVSLFIVHFICIIVIYFNAKCETRNCLLISRSFILAHTENTLCFTKGVHLR